LFIDKSPWISLRRRTPHPETMVSVIPEHIRQFYNFESHYLMVNGCRYHYVDEGKGEPVVLLHGNPSWSFMYRKLINALRADYRMIAPDHVGCGLSEKPDSSKYSYSLEQRVLDLEQLLHTLGISNNITLVMHDWGGPIGMAYAKGHFETINRLIVLNTAAFFLPSGKRLHWCLRVGRNRPFGGLLIRGLNVMVLGATNLGFHKSLPQELRRCYAAPYNSWRNRVAILRFVQDIPLAPSDQSYPVLKSVEESLFRFQQAPILICWGERDFIFDTDFLDEWIRRFPAAEVHRFPKAGHYVLEDADDLIIPLVKDFLDRHVKGGALDD
jgi:haloalkane dehalogenase